jgi:hypothetical protein
MTSVLQMEGQMDERITELITELSTRYAQTGKKCNLSDWVQWRKIREVLHPI